MILLLRLDTKNSLPCVSLTLIQGVLTVPIRTVGWALWECGCFYRIMRHTKLWGRVLQG